jgi:hypothetical protein
MENLSATYLPNTNTEKRFHVTWIYPINENTFVRSEILSSYVTDRPYTQVTEPANAPSGSMVNNEEETSCGFIVNTESIP